MNYLTTAEVNLSQLKKNYHILSNKIKNSTVMCAVKANAYGMGSVECSKALFEEGCRDFAVANLDEALEIKPFVGDSNILILGCTLPEDAEILSDNSSFIQNIYSFDYANLLLKNIPNGKKVRCHFKIDTGMNRLGFKYFSDPNDQRICKIYDLYKNEKFNVEGIFTHFYNSDENEKQTFEQYERFKKTIEILSNNNMSFKIKHVSNSAALMKYEFMNLDMVRAGLILYGYKPEKNIETECKPILSLKTHITNIHYIEKGETVSYGAKFVAEKKIRVGTLAIGYADGLCRNYNGYNNNEGKRSTVIVNGKKATIIGNICMDQCMCDISDIDAKIGDEVIVVGENNPVEIFSDAGNTISYEFITLLSKRAKRKYIES